MVSLECALSTHPAATHPRSPISFPSTPGAAPMAVLAPPSSLCTTTTTILQRATKVIGCEAQIWPSHSTARHPLTPSLSKSFSQCLVIWPLLATPALPHPAPLSTLFVNVPASLSLLVLATVPTSREFSFPVFTPLLLILQVGAKQAPPRMGQCL